MILCLSLPPLPPFCFFLSSSLLPLDSETTRATFCTLRSGTGWTSSALLWTPPGPRRSTSSTSSTSCRRGSRRTAAKWWDPPTSCSLATSPPANAASPSSSRSSRPTSGATSSRACKTTTSSVSGGPWPNAGSMCVCALTGVFVEPYLQCAVGVGWRAGGCYDCMVDFWLCLSVFVYFRDDSADWAGVFTIIRFENCVWSSPQAEIQYRTCTALKNKKHNKTKHWWHLRVFFPQMK